MKNFLTGILCLGLASSLNNCATTAADSEPTASSSTAPLTFKSHTAEDTGFKVNSHLVIGENDALLIDAQFTRSEARKVAELVKASGKNLRTIYITHGHPDHYFGLEVLAKEFPQAKIQASSATVAEIKATGTDKQKYWKPMYKDDLTDTVVIPEELAGNVLKLEGHALQIIELLPGESEHATVVLDPQSGTVITGDLVFNKVHLWLAEGRPDSWIKNLAAMESRTDIKTVLPGHGTSAKLDSKIFKTNAAYIQNAVAIAKNSKTKDVALAKIKRQYPNYSLPIIADLTFQAMVKK